MLVFLQQDINKRLSLPVDLHLPEAFVAKQNASPSLEEPLSRASRRQSLSEIGFGRLETYTKLDRLGQVRLCAFGKTFYFEKKNRQVFYMFFLKKLTGFF